MEEFLNTLQGTFQECIECINISMVIETLIETTSFFIFCGKMDSKIVCIHFAAQTLFTLAILKDGCYDSGVCLGCMEIFPNG